MNADQIKRMSADELTLRLAYVANDLLALDHTDRWTDTDRESDRSLRAERELIRAELALRGEAE